MNELDNCKKEYLSELQIEEIKTKTPVDFDKVRIEEVARQIDFFVRLNGANDEKYELLFSLFGKCCKMMEPDMVWDDFIQVSLPMMYYAAYFDLLVFTGVFGEKELADLQKEAIEKLNPDAKTTIPTA